MAKNWARSLLVASLLCMCLALSLASTVSVQWNQYHAGVSGMSRGCGCLKIRTDCKVEVSGNPGTDLFVNDEQCDSLRVMEILSLVSWALVTVTTVLYVALVAGGGDGYSHRAHVVVACVSFVAMCVGIAVASVLAELTRKKGIRGEGIASDMFVSGVGGNALFFLYAAATACAPSAMEKNWVLRGVMTTLIAGTMVLQSVAVEMPDWTHIQVRQDLITVPHFQTVYTQMHQNLGVVPADTHIIARADTIITPSATFRNSELVLGLWETCLCAEISPQTCKWSGAKVFEGDSCDQTTAAFGLAWASIGLLIVTLYHYVLFEDFRVGAYLYVPLAFACQLVSTILFTSHNVWKHTHGRGDLIGRAVYFASFAIILQGALVVVCLFISLRRTTLTPINNSGDNNNNNNYQLVPTDKRSF